MIRDVRVIVFLKLMVSILLVSGTQRLRGKRIGIGGKERSCYCPKLRKKFVLKGDANVFLLSTLFAGMECSSMNLNKYFSHEYDVFQRNLYDVL